MTPWNPQNEMYCNNTFRYDWIIDFLVDLIHDPKGINWQSIPYAL